MNGLGPTGELVAPLGGLGVALLPCLVCGGGVRGGRLIHVLPEWSEPADTEITAVYPASRNLSPKVRVFVDFLAERFGGTPYWDEGLNWDEGLSA